MGPLKYNTQGPNPRRDARATGLRRVPYGYAPLVTWHQPAAPQPQSVRPDPPRNAAAWWAFSLGLGSLMFALRAHEDTLAKAAIALSLLAMASGIIGLSISGMFRLKKGRWTSTLGLMMAALALIVSPRPSGPVSGPGLTICEPACPYETECVPELPPAPEARPLPPHAQAAPKAPAANQPLPERQTAPPAPRQATPPADPDEQEEQF